MATIREFEFPEGLYYQVEKHIWVKPLGDDLVRLGMTPVAYKLLRDSLVAISLRSRSVGQEVLEGKSVAMVESLKYIGPLAAPFTGVLVRGNKTVEENPDVAAADPYGDGWIAEMRLADRDAALARLVTGDAAMAAYDALLQSERIAWT